MIKDIFSFIFETLKIIVIAFLIVMPIRYFLFQPFLVKGSSMLPNFENRDYLLVDEISFRFREPQRGEIIVFKPPTESSSRYIKRVVGLPRETIEIRAGEIKVFQNGSQEPDILKESDYLDESVFTSGDIKINLSDSEFFVLGDNRQFSSDSRSFGALDRENIVGRVFFRAFPFDKLDKIKVASY